MSNIPLKGGDGNEEAVTTERANGTGNQAKMSDCWKNLTTPKKAGVVALPVISVAAIIALIVLLVTGGPELLDCSQDTFTPVEVGSDYLKYKAIPGGFDVLSWEEARKKCEEEGTTVKMWEVMNKVEWNAIYTSLEEKSIWINGKSNEECPKDQQQKCNADAMTGNGLKMSWSSNPNTPAEYSKFIGGEENGCMSINAEGLWVNINCNNNKLKAVCVKRLCKRPDK